MKNEERLEMHSIQEGLITWRKLSGAVLFTLWTDKLLEAGRLTRSSSWSKGSIPGQGSVEKPLDPRVAEYSVTWLKCLENVDGLPVFPASVFPRSQFLPWWSSAPTVPSAPLWWSTAPVWWSSVPPWWSSAQIWRSYALPWRSSATPWWAPAPSALLWRSSAPSAPPCWAPVLSAPPWCPALPALPQFQVSSLPHGPGPPSLPLFRLCSTTLLDGVMFGASGSRVLYALIPLLAIATLQSPCSFLSLALPVFLCFILARVSWINPFRAIPCFCSVPVLSCVFHSPSVSCCTECLLFSSLCSQYLPLSHCSDSVYCLAWIIARVPGLSLCLALLDTVRPSSTFACPRITLCLVPAIPVCLCFDPACIYDHAFK
ncbi:uncharacterized protein LOC131531030 [Onychostoma macrolepis]|uniref:uncharacterized protein LOC131531030 n=1 Tax=Onychostoma macrolepis TaxID=369639 RepID=UPI00272AB874|nr:uncharacterized protein LOC131531030 [Onychostoma macrolepis]